MPLAPRGSAADPARHSFGEATLRDPFCANWLKCEDEALSIVARCCKFASSLERTLPPPWHNLRLSGEAAESMFVTTQPVTPMSTSQSLSPLRPRGIARQERQ